MIFLQIAILFAAILFGARLGSIGIGFAGGAGVLALALLGIAPGSIPIDVILIIMSVIAATAAMQAAGGLDYLVGAADKLLRKRPRHITFLAPLVTYAMTLMAGTGHTAFSALPVIAEVAKEQGIRPSRPLSIAVVASQVAITASPISAAVVFFSTLMDPLGVDYLQILAVCIPSTLLAVIVASFAASFMGKDLEKDKVYQHRLQLGLVKPRSRHSAVILPHARASVWIFIASIAMVMCYAVIISDKVGIMDARNAVLSRDQAIMVFMLTAATSIAAFCKIEPSSVLNAPTFKSGMSACVCVLGVAWLGTTFVGAHSDQIRQAAGGILQSHPWLLAATLLFASMLLYSQAATAKALMPIAVSLSAAPLTLVASFAAVSGLFILPTYPTLIASVEMDDTGSTRIGKFIFDHPFLVPGLLTISLSVLFGYIWGRVII
jgi:anaerobic C4-dicarboxylate transporter DcuA